MDELKKKHGKWSADFMLVAAVKQSDCLIKNWVGQYSLVKFQGVYRHS